MLRKLRRARRRSLAAGTAAVVVVASGGVAAASTIGWPINPFGTNQVGTLANGRVQLPDNQYVAAYGHETQFPGYTVGMGISPDGTKVAVQGSSAVNLLDASTGAIVQSFGGDGGTAPVYSPDGTALYVATTGANGYTHAVVEKTGYAPPPIDKILKYTVGPDGLVTDPTSPQVIALTDGTDPMLPTGMIVSGLTLSSDGTKLYATLGATNQLAVIDTSTNQVETTVPVGNDPQAVAIVGNQAFVANRGGRPARAGDTTVLSDGTQIVSNPKTGSSSTGTVSVVDLSTNKDIGTINVGLQPNSVTVHDGSLFVTNANSDTVSVIDAVSHRVTQTFNVEPLPGSTVGASPTSVAFPDANHLLVTVEGDNAVAEFSYDGPHIPVQYEGLVPTDWRPEQVAYDTHLGKVFVNNVRGIGTDGGPTSSSIVATVTSFSPPADGSLGYLTSQVFDNNGWDHLPSSNASAGEDGDQGGALPAIPTELGQPSAIKHVFLIINENKTYDSVLGDIGKGTSDPSDESFGAQVTPNKHSLANTFTLFDNFYDPSQVSYDGHQYVDQAGFDNYGQSNEVADFPRDTVGIGSDGLIAQSSGYLWNTVGNAGKTVKDFGEYDHNGPVTGTVGSWQQYYADSQILEGKAAGPLPAPENQAEWYSALPSVNAILDHEYPGVNHNVPDQYRADVWQQQFSQQLQTNRVPNLTVMWLPTDHTGAGPNDANAEVADNDLADGRVISAISHSSVWKNSAVFVEEDDSALGSDHIDGNRAPLWIASPYATRGVVNSSYYTQVNVDKTIEQILGAQPMNQMDRAAVPMFDAFTNAPNFTPYDALPNNVPITEGVTGLIPLSPSAGSSDTPAQTASLAATAGPSAPPVRAAEQSVAAAWTKWDQTVAVPTIEAQGVDSINPAQMNRYDWYSGTNFTKPYLGDAKILAPDEVPGRNVTDLSGGN